MRAVGMSFEVKNFTTDGAVSHGLTWTILYLSLSLLSKKQINVDLIFDLLSRTFNVFSAFQKWFLLVQNLSLG